MDREHRRHQIAGRLHVRRDGEVRHIRLDRQTVVGRLSKDAQAGRWLLAWRNPEQDGPWYESPNEFDGKAPAEIAEAWAVEEVASLLEMGEAAGRPSV